MLFGSRVRNCGVFQRYPPYTSSFSFAFTFFCNNFLRVINITSILIYVSTEITSPKTHSILLYRVRGPFISIQWMSLCINQFPSCVLSSGMMNLFFSMASPLYFFLAWIVYSSFNQLGFHQTAQNAQHHLVLATSFFHPFLFSYKAAPPKQFDTISNFIFRFY